MRAAFLLVDLPCALAEQATAVPRTSTPPFMNCDQDLVELGGLELELLSGRERSGSPLAKS